MPRRVVEHTDGSTAIVRGEARDMPSAVARAVRGGARYRPSWILLLLIVPLILAVVVMDAVLWPAVLANLRADGSFMGDPATSPMWTQFAIEMALMVAAGALWAVWLAMCLRNIPALTGTWPGFGFSDVLLSPFGRRSGYWRPMQIVREVVDCFANGRAWPHLLVTAWWIAWLGTVMVPAALSLLRMVSGAPLRDQLQVVLVRPFVVAIAAVLAIGVLVTVEWLQHRARVELASMPAGGPPRLDGAAALPVTAPPAVPARPTPAILAPSGPGPTPAAQPLAAPASRGAWRGRGRSIALVVTSITVVGVVGAVVLIGTPVQPGPGAVGAVVDPSPSPDAPPPKPTPTPTSAPIEHPVIARMLAYTHDPALSGRWELRTEVESGDWAAETSRVEVARSGGDGWTRLWATESGVLWVVAESALIDGQVYTRRPNQPWDEETPETTPRPPIVVAAEPWDRLTYEGRVQRDGERLHRIGFARYGSDAGREFEKAFAAREGTVTDTTGWILVRDDGTPVLLAARIDAEIDGGNIAVIRMTTQYRDMGSAVDVSLGGMPRPVR